MKTAKRMMCLLLVAMMLLSMVACSNAGTQEPTEGQKETNPPAVNADPTEPAEVDPFAEHMTITIAYWDIENTITHAESDVILKYVEDKFNITIEPVNITWSNYEDQLTLWAASNQLPDVMAGIATEKKQFAELARDGIIRSISQDMLAKYPNVQEYMSSDSAAKCVVDGEYYAIYRASFQSPAATMIQNQICYRWDLAQAAGVTKEPETWDEFIDMLEKIQEANPSMTGLTSTSLSSLSQVFLRYAVPEAVADGNGARWVDNGDGTIVPAYLAGENLGDEALKVFELARGMYEVGMIDPDIAVITSDEAMAKFATGKAAAICVSNVGDPLKSTFIPYIEETGNNIEEAYRYLELMPSYDGVTYLAPTDDWSENYFSANVDDAKMERILALYDWLFTDEGFITTYFGFEGETYEMTESGPAYLSTDMTSAVCPSINFWNQWARWPEGFVRPAEFTVRYDVKYGYLNEVWDEAVAVASAAPRQPGFDALLDAEAKTAYRALDSKFVLHIQQDFVKILTGKDDVATMWQEILAEYERNGLSDVIAAVTDACK